MAKKARKPFRKAGSKAGQSRRGMSGKATPSPSGDRRALERVHVDVHALLEQQDFQTIGEANEFLAREVTGRVPPRATPATDLARAQDRMYDAFEATSRRQRIKLAREALTISADCADAYVLLAEEEAKTPEQALELYQQGVEAGERALGPQAFDELKGSFWGFLETRPYMRAREGLAMFLWAVDRREEAMAHLQAMLELNPNDNQGVRCLLAMWLLELRRLDALGALLKQYRDDAMIEMVWANALWTFLTKGPEAAARRCFRKAVERNPHVMFLLLEKHAPELPTGYITVGGEDEAASLLHHLLPVLGQHDDIGQWFAQETRALISKPLPDGPPAPTRGWRPH